MFADGAGQLSEIVKFLDSEATPAPFNLRSVKAARNGPGKHVYAAGATIADYDEQRRAVLLIVSGWAATGKELADGSRTVVDFSLSGDVVTIGSTEWARESVTALSNVILFEFPGAIYESLPHYPGPVREFILKGVARRYARAAEHVVNISRRGAVERVAHLLLELACRVDARENNGKICFQCPLTQADLGDALGLSGVHVNRVLRKLREGGYASFRGGVVEFQDRRALVELASFDSAYLSLPVA